MYGISAKKGKYPFILQWHILLGRSELLVIALYCVTGLQVR